MYIYKPKRPKTKQEHANAIVADLVSWLEYYIKQYKKTSINTRHRNKVFDGVSFFGSFHQTKDIRYWSIAILMMILSLIVFVCMIEYNSTLNERVQVWYDYKARRD